MPRMEQTALCGVPESQEPGGLQSPNTTEGHLANAQASSRVPYGPAGPSGGDHVSSQLPVRLRRWR